ncbi:MAG: TlpA family protein disulfide reductase [Bacteroidales bacterium]|nr:TlpA family protein disulfide reductase [Bacteroidales bacterium]
MKKIFAVFAVLMLSVTAYAQLPSVNLKTIDGKSLRVDTLKNDGKPMIIDFFATWCKPCNRELNEIAEVYEEWQEETGVKLVAISIDKAQDTHKVAPLVAENEWPWETVLLDPNQELMRVLGIQMIPFTLIVDGEGKIVYKHNGYTDGAEEELIEKVREIVNK